LLCLRLNGALAPFVLGKSARHHPKNEWCLALFIPGQGPGPYCPDMLRQPLENEKVTISRVHSTVTYPAKFIFIASMNPCPCGYKGSSKQYCTCTEKQIKAYKGRVSGPILNRMDILLTLEPVKLKGHDFKGIESSIDIKARVMAARERQHTRYGREICNGKVSFEQLTKTSPLTHKQQRQLQQLSMKHGLSNRVQIKLIPLARTIADLKGEEAISDESVEEAMELRRMRPQVNQIAQSGFRTGERSEEGYEEST
jgi:magnesium chelatase family protein